jgi:hypothetical protein
MREAMRLIALGLLVLAAGCVSTRAMNPTDPVDMAAELGDLGWQYVGMGEVCDAQVAGGRRAAIVQIVQNEQQRLGALSDLVNRAYRGHATPELSAHLQAQTSAHQVSTAAFCAAVVAQARADLSARATHVLTLRGQADGLDLIRQANRLPYPDMPSVEPIGYSAWVEGISVIPLAD